MTENANASDAYDGGSGSNVLVLHMTRADWMRDAMQADIAKLLSLLTSTASNANGLINSSGFTFTSVGLQVRKIASLEVWVDGVKLDPRDEAIVAVADAQTTATEHSIVTGNVVANDGVPDLVRDVTVVTGPALGVLTLQNDGSFVYDPGMAFNSLAVGETATAAFTYRVTDADRDSATATNTITITGTNDAPIAFADTRTTTENTAVSVDVLANDTDVDTSDTHVVDSVKITTAGAQGTVAIVDNKVAWNPGTDFDYLAVGDVASVKIDYTQNDKHGGTAGATLALTVNGVNDKPTVQAALKAGANEEDAPFTINLLAGAGDVDRGAVINVATFAEPGGKGGWVLNGNSLTIDPNHFDDLNTGENELLKFNYVVRDEHGAEVAQTLAVNIEGFTDAPSLFAESSVAAAVNEIKLTITSEPAKNEKVILRFSDLPAGVKVLNAQRVDVTAGVDFFHGTHNFFVVLPPGTDADFDLGITVTGLRPNGSPIASATGALDIVYDHTAAFDEITFETHNQGIWDSGPAPMVQWHEYIPLIGTVSQTWDAWNEKWVDTGSGAWRSGEFKLFSAEVDAKAAQDIAKGVAQSTLDTAWSVFLVASKTVDAVAQGIYDTAVTAWNWAESEAWRIFNAVVTEASRIFNETVDAAWDAGEAIINGVYWLAEGAADVLRDGLIALTVAGTELGDKLIRDYNNAYDDTVYWLNETRKTSLHDLDVSLDFLRTEAGKVKQAVVDEGARIREGALSYAKGFFDAAKTEYATAKQKAFDLADGVFDLAQKAFDDIASALTAVQGKTKLDIMADLYADVGVQVDFVLDSGSVDTKVDYTLTSVLQHNRTTDVLVITPQLTNQTTGDSVAFNTISPNASLKAVLLYDVGVNLTVLLDSYLTVHGQTIWDISPGSVGIGDSTTVTTGGWGVDFEKFKAGILQAAGDLNLDGVVVGELELINIDTTEMQDYEVPFIGTLTEGIASVFLGVPTIETEGTAATWEGDYFVEGGLININFDEITDSVMNLVNARIDYSPELKTALGVGSLYDSETFADVIASIGTAFLGTLFEALDGQSESMPIFLIDANDTTPSELGHLNLFPDSVIGGTVTPNTAKYGFWTAYGESNDLVKVVIDIDQAVAVIVNKIIEVAAGAASSGATVQFLAKLPDINPLDLEFGLAELLSVVEVPQATIDEITKFFDLSVGFEAADVDVYSTLKFSQEFSLTVDDMLYRVTMEDGDEYFFEANDEGSLRIDNASSHDANHDGQVDYTMQLVPKALFSNDTEIGLTIGYVLDFLQASLSADLKLPIDDLLNISIPGLPDIKINLADINLGPLLRVQGDLDIASADIFEKRFSFDLGSVDVDGSATLSDDALVLTLIGVPENA